MQHAQRRLKTSFNVCCDKAFDAARTRMMVPNDCAIRNYFLPTRGSPSHAKAIRNTSKFDFRVPSCLTASKGDYLGSDSIKSKAHETQGGQKVARDLVVTGGDASPILGPAETSTTLAQQRFTPGA